MVGCSTIVCIRVTARTSSGSMSVNIEVKNSIGRRQRCAIDVLLQQMVWPLLHSQLRYSAHWHLDENAISRPTRSSTRMGCLTDRVLRWRPDRPVRARETRSVLLTFLADNGHPEVMLA